jgi:hypothetical protein
MIADGSGQVMKEFQKIAKGAKRHAHRQRQAAGGIQGSSELFATDS